MNSSHDTCILYSFGLGVSVIVKRINFDQGIYPSYRSLPTFVTGGVGTSKLRSAL
jgi:hypothetical protein